MLQKEMEVFYNTPPLGKRGTSSYLTKAVMIQLLQGEVKPCKDDPCSVSWTHFPPPPALSPSRSCFSFLVQFIFSM